MLVVVGRRDEDLLEGGHRGAGERAEDLGPDRHLAPAQDTESLGDGELLDRGLGVRARVGVERQVGGAHGVLPGVRQVEVDHVAEERVRHLAEDAGAVTGPGVGPDRTAVLEVAERAEGGVDDVVPGRPAKRRHHGETAGVLLVRRVVHAGGVGDRGEPSVRRAEPGRG